MSVCDFSKSFVRWGLDTTQKAPLTVSQETPFTLNLVRAPAECLAEFTEVGSGAKSSYLLGASCKTEQVNVDRDIWHHPNADFCMVAGDKQFLGLKRWDKTEKGIMRHPPSLGVQPERQVEEAEDAFTHYAVEIRKTAGRAITDIEELISILEAGGAIVSRTEIQTAGWHCALEYPVKTINYSTRERYYQVDTGPVLFPDPDSGFSDFPGSFHLAYVAHNHPAWTEFLLCVPTPLTPDISVHHFEKSVRMECHNSMIAIEGTW